MAIHYIYLITNLINNKKYIGQRKCPEDKNIQNDSYLGSGTLLLKAIKKYGRKNFKKTILEFCSNNQEADLLEEKYFKLYDVLNKQEEFYNRAFPGQFWRPEGHSEFVSEIMKDFYKDNEKSKNFYLRLGYKNREEYLKIKNDKKLKSKRIWLIQTLKKIKNKKKKEENPLSLYNCKSLAEKTKLEWTIPEIRNKRIENMNKASRTRSIIFINPKIKIIDNIVYKECTCCHEFEKLDKFDNDKHGLKGKYSKCKRCKKNKDKRYNKNKKLILC